MKKNLLTALAILICYQFATAQKASDVLENGIHLKSGNKIFLQYDTKALKFDAAKSLQDPTNPPDFTTLDDSTIFLVSKNGINVYLRPLNPLNFSYNSENKVVIDPINEAAATALGSIIDVLGTVNPTKAAPPAAAGDKKKKAAPEPPVKCEKFKTLQTKIELIQTKLSDSKKPKTVEIFKKLKALDFLDETSTKADLVTTKASIAEIENHFKEVAALIDEAKTDVKNYDCDFPESFTAQYIFNAILKDLASTMEEQKKRLDNLQTSYNLVEKAQQTASIGGGENGLRWCFKLDEIPSKEGKISVYTISIKESGYKLSDKEEIVSIESKDVLKRTFRVRKFQRFVPEVSVGTAFTFLKYNSYGTTSDSTGQQFVGSPTENTIKNLNITTMINFNYYIPNSPIHPLYQIGVGINSGIPTLLTGFGLRSNINGIKRLAIAGGIAMTWVKELDKLSVGDKISGTDDIDKDFKYSAAPKFTPYIALQYNF
jgi:hypothetical protein